MTAAIAALQRRQSEQLGEVLFEVLLASEARQTATRLMLAMVGVLVRTRPDGYRSLADDWVYPDADYVRRRLRKWAARRQRPYARYQPWAEQFTVEHDPTTDTFWLSRSDAQQTGCDDKPTGAAAFLTIHPPSADYPRRRVLWH